jgi:signal transduction histidine kinase/DNA-binding response OmpR family regulator
MWRSLVCVFGFGLALGGGVLAAEPGRAPRAVVESLRVGNQEVPVHDGVVRLLPHQRSFALELSAAPGAPQSGRFLFRLIPYELAWIDAGSRRMAFYTDVPPGKYTFQVLASGPGGRWSERPDTVRIEVVARFWETRWFLGLCGFAALAAGVTLVLWRRGRRRAGRERLQLLVDERTATIAAQAGKLREMDGLRSQFFANVSHELRTPLTLILGPLADALEGRFGPVSGELRSQLATAGRNGQRLLALVDQLLDVARLDAGRLRLRVRRGDLAVFVRERTESFLPLAERREIDLVLEVPETAEAWYDEEQLGKVLDNLLSNALKFTPRQGRVAVVLHAPPDAGQAGISVRDTGPGIPADQVERIFDRFHQAETVAQRWPGVGIGLALSRQLVELHHGSITVDSTPGAGSCFTVTLRRGHEHFPAELLDHQPQPRRPISSGWFVASPSLFADPGGTEEEEAAEPEEAGPDFGEDRTTVLVVEDNPEVRAYIRSHLEPGYRVVEAADGDAGLAAARRLVPDLVVSDVMMPGLDGNALFRSLRDDPELALVPVVLLTAKASAESRIQGLRDGVDDYLVKPFDPRELKARVDNLIASRKRLLERLGAAGQPPRPLRISEVRVSSADEAFLSRVQAVVEERLGDTELTVEALAEAVGCDRSYLLRRLRALTGEPPSGLIRSLRLQRAEQLLRAGAGTVSEIAYGVGFKSVAHFSNAFQEKYGERPSAFAARHKL